MFIIDGRLGRRFDQGRAAFIAEFGPDTIDLPALSADKFESTPALVTEPGAFAILMTAGWTVHFLIILPAWLLFVEDFFGVEIFYMEFLLYFSSALR